MVIDSRARPIGRGGGEGGAELTQPAVLTETHPGPHLTSAAGWYQVAAIARTMRRP